MEKKVKKSFTIKMAAAAELFSQVNLVSKLTEALARVPNKRGSLSLELTFRKEVFERAKRKKETISGNLKVTGDNNPAFFGTPEHEALAASAGITTTGMANVLSQALKRRTSVTHVLCDAQSIADLSRADREKLAFWQRFPVASRGEIVTDFAKEIGTCLSY